MKETPAKSDGCSRHHATGMVNAHQALDKAVDLCWRPRAFINETKRIEFLFELFDKVAEGMFGGCLG